ncbi:Prephenate dehydrogenase [Gloeothece citriformis PCC 7424]|uniref:Prephenate dehydrogenase n=1 Tax=Gloeothece citriformis (strain PCC 7424) TaxID=65393 RepID=B7KHJ6_GLOC7|nr:prephenate dehydrogenase/arogenate dehydrogenase family protein [Gloeothece citriformis]ACK70691.1 Prephenate dehydrogenase [Gloeothece citriformis PCC 7424]
MLKQIDRDLIELLAKKIAFLREANLKGINVEETSDMSQLLEQMGVPEFVWKNITLNCVAASQSYNQSTLPVKPKRITIIGGSGKMGRFFTLVFQEAGHQVSILEHQDWHKAPELIGKAELVLVCVNIEHTLTVVEKAAPYLTPSTILAEITSFKTTIVPKLLELHSGPVVSLHPMFGPGVTSFLSQNVIVCGGRQLEACQWILDLIERQGGQLTFCSIAEHDRMMAVVQGMRHFAVFGLGVFLAQEKVNLERSLEFASPLYRLQLDMIGRLFATDGSLSLKMMLSLFERRQFIGRLGATYHHLAQLVAEQDKIALEQEFETTRHFFREQVDRAVEETDYIINSLGVLLADGKSEIDQSQKDSNNNNTRQAA